VERHNIPNANEGCVSRSAELPEIVTGPCASRTNTATRTQTGDCGRKTAFLETHGSTSASQSARATRRPTGPTSQDRGPRSLLPRRSTEIVRICEIFTHEGFGIMAAGSAIVNGNPARCAWLVIAIAITVSDFLLNRSWLRIRTGRSPACSRPRTGFRSAQYTSPLSIRAKRGLPDHVRPTAFPLLGRF
jgi:hypothetical protein